MATFAWDGPETGPAVHAYLVEVWSNTWGQQAIACVLPEPAGGGRIELWREHDEQLEITVMALSADYAAGTLVTSPWSETSGPLTVPEVGLAGLLAGIIVLALLWRRRLARGEVSDGV